MSDICWCGGEYVQGVHVISFKQEEKLYIEVDALICKNCQQPSQESLGKVDMVKLLEEARDKRQLEEEERLKVLRRIAEYSKNLGYIIPKSYNEDMVKYLEDINSDKIPALTLSKGGRGIRLCISHYKECISTEVDEHQISKLVERMDELRG
jgi:hypothetical protein